MIQPETRKPLVSSPSGYPEVAAFVVLLATAMLLFSVIGTLYGINTFVILAGMGISGLAAYRTSSAIGPLSPLKTMVWLAVAAPFLIIPILSSFVPPLSWDEVAYSVTLPKFFAEAKKFFYVGDIGIYSAFPASYETLTTASLLLWNSIAPIRLLGVVSFAAMGGIAVLLSAIATDRRPVALLTGALVVAAGVGTFAPHVKNDFINGALQAAAVLFTCAYLQRPNARWATLLGVALGASCAIKYNSLQFVVCLGICAVLCFARIAHAVVQWRRHLIFLCVASFVSGAFWYGRNIAIFDNPVYPFFGSVFGDQSAKAVQLSAVVKEMFFGYAGFSYSMAPVSVFADALLQQFGPVVLGLGAIGVVRLTLQLRFLPPARRRAAEFMILFTLGYTIICFFFGLWAPRYFVVLLVCYAALSASSLDWLFDALDQTVFKRKAVQWIATGVLGLGVLTHTVDRQWRESAWLANGLIAGVSDELLSSSAVNYWNVADWINKNLPVCSKIGIGIDVQPYYYVDRKFYNFTPLSEDFLEIDLTDQFAARFRELGLTHIALQDFAGRILYSEQTNPVMYRFINGLYSSIAEMEARGSAVPLAQVPGLQGRVVRFYRLRDEESTLSQKAGNVGAGPVSCARPNSEAKT